MRETIHQTGDNRIRSYAQSSEDSGLRASTGSCHDHRLQIK